MTVELSQNARECIELFGRSRRRKKRADTERPSTLRSDALVYVPEHPLRVMTLERLWQDAAAFPSCRNLQFTMVGARARSK